MEAGSDLGMEATATDANKLGVAAATAIPGETLSPRSPRSTDEQGLFVNSSMTTGAFGGLVEAQNGLAAKLCRAQDQVESLQQELTQAKRTTEELAAQQKEEKARQDQRHEETLRQNAELHEALKKLIDEKASALQESQTDAVKALDAALNPQIQAIQRTVEDIATAQQEVTTKTLPRWRADVGSEVQSFKDLLAKQQEHTDTALRDHDQRLAQTATDVEAARADFAARLSKEAADLSARISAAEGKSAELADAIVACEGKIGSAEQRLANTLELQIQKLEDNFALDGKTREQLKINEDHQSSMFAAFTQADFERLAFAERTSKRIQGLEAELIACRKWSEEKLQADVNSTKLSLDQARADLNARLDNEVNGLSARYDSLAAADKEHSAVISHVDSRLSGECAGLRSKLDDECKRLELAAKNEAANVLNAIRTDEGPRLARLEGKFTEAEQERAIAAQRFCQELQLVRVEVAAKIDALENRADAADNKTKQHLERVQEAMDCLNRELQDFVQVQEAREQDTNRLEQLVQALESRVCPWRARDQRGQSPGRPFQQLTDDAEGVVRTGGGYKKGTGLTDGVFDLIDKNRDGVVTRNEFRNANVDWKNWSFAPKAPPSRPTSAPKTRRREEKDVGNLGAGASIQGVPPPAGAAFAAARAKGAPMTAR